MEKSDHHSRDKPKEQSLLSEESKENLKEFSLKAAGYGYLLGDAALYAAGISSGRTKEANAGLLWGLGGLVLARYGKPNTERQLAQLSERLKEHFDEQGIAIPKGSELTPERLARTGGIIEKMEDFLYANPSQVLNALYAVGGVQLTRSGMQHNKVWDTASGVLVTTGALAGLLLPEKTGVEKPEESTEDKGAFAKAWNWIREKPLRISAIMYTLNNATMLTSAINERKANPADKSYVFKLLTVASYVVSNGLLSISSKDHTEQAKGEEGRVLPGLEVAAAKVIAAQPEEVQDALLQQTAGYLAGQKEIKKNANEIARELRERIEELAKAPQALSALPEPDEHRSAAWQDRVSTTQPGQSPSPSV